MPDVNQRPSAPPQQRAHLAHTRWVRVLLLAAVPAMLLGVTVVVAAAGGDPAAPPVVVATIPLSPTPTPTPSPTATPTPRPYDGLVARLSAPELGIDHYIEQVFVVDNQMQSPTDGVHAIGWYPGLGKPGFGKNAIFAAHETWSNNPGPFYQLHRAAPGDAMTITMDDGTEYHYEVLSNTRYDAATIPMGEILQPPERPRDEEWITLITCGGRFISHGEFGEYLDRDVVVARRVTAPLPVMPDEAPLIP